MLYIYIQHWTPRSNKNIVEEDEDDSGFANLDPISVFSKSVQRKEKKGLDLSLCKESMQSDDFSKSKGREADKSRSGKAERKVMDGEVMKNVGRKSVLSDSLGVHAVVVSMDVDAEAMRSELTLSSVTEMDLDDSCQLHQQENVKDDDSDNFSRESESMVIDDGQVSAKRMFHNDSAKVQFGRMEKIDSNQTKQFQNL
ncbi:hypothetical protein REPUB_Repub04eG0034500 [Reevesia pubescens]